MKCGIPAANATPNEFRAEIGSLPGCFPAETYIIRQLQQCNKCFISLCFLSLTRALLC